MITGTVNFGRLAPLLRQAPAIARPAMQSFMRDSARALISSSGAVPGLVQVTPPSQGKANTAAKKTGEAAVMRDIYQVYTTPGKVYELLRALDAGAAAAFWIHVKKKRWEVAQSILDRFPSLPSYARKLEAFDDGREHRARRGRNGRVRGNKPSMIIAEPKWVRRYIREKQQLVGMLAASIPSAYNGRFGALKGVPAWISRHGGSWARGYVTERQDTNGTLITIGLDAGSELNAETQRRFNYVLGYRVKAMQRQIPFIARSLEAKIAAQIGRV